MVCHLGNYLQPNSNSVCHCLIHTTRQEPVERPVLFVITNGILNQVFCITHSSPPPTTLFVTAFRIGRFSKPLDRCAWALVVNQNSRALLAMRVSKRKTARVAGFWFTSIVPNSCFCLWRKAAERNMYNSKSTKRSLPTSIRRQSSMSNCHSLRTRILK